jgi:hypothetical protein
MPGFVIIKSLKGLNISNHRRNRWQEKTGSFNPEGVEYKRRDSTPSGLIKRQRFFHGFYTWLFTFNPYQGY